MNRRVWVPGMFPSTNQAIRLAKEEGAWFARHGRAARPPVEGYSWWASYTRGHTKLHALAARLAALRPGERVDVAIGFVGHPRFDGGDAWTFAGKWMLDGLVDARVLPSDRKNVRRVGGRCFTTEEEGVAYLAAKGQPFLCHPGALIELEEVTS